MNQKTITKLLLVILPLVAVVLAGMANAVTVCTVSETETLVTYCSFFTYVEDVQAAICMPFAGICGAIVFGMAVLYLVKPADLWLTGITVTAFASLSLAVLPIVFRAQTYMVPNMWVPILMGVESMTAYGILKTPMPEEEKKSRATRLQK